MHCSTTLNILLIFGLVLKAPFIFSFSIHHSSGQQQCTNILGGICVSGSQCATMNGTTVYQLCPSKFSCCLARNTPECIKLKGVCMFVLEEKSVACDSTKSQFLDGVCGEQNAAKCCIPKLPSPTDVIIDFDKTLVWKILSLFLGLSFFGYFVYIKREAICQLVGQQANINSNGGTFSNINTHEEITHVTAVAPNTAIAEEANGFQQEANINAQGSGHYSRINVISKVTAAPTDPNSANEED